jgi:hypothetical protein
MKLLDLYTDYLIVSNSHTTATGLSNVLDNAISHDKITRFLSKEVYDSKTLWALVKPSVRKIEAMIDSNSFGFLIVDDTIEEKHYTDENDIICYHYDHCFNRTVKGVNILSCVYHVENISIPVAFEIVKKPLEIDEKTGKQKRKSKKTKNELMLEMLSVCIENKLLFKYVLADNWFSSKENMNYLKTDLKKDFIMAVKSNRLVALSKEDKEKGKFQNIEALCLEPNTVKEVYFKGVDFPMLLLKQVFKNKDGSEGVLYLASSDTNLDYDQMTLFYKKRWNIETYHKSIKSICSLSKSPTQTIKTQSNHFFTSIFSFFKLESLKIKSNLNHFALKSKIYIRTLKTGYQEFLNMKASYAYSIEN